VAFGIHCMHLPTSLLLPSTTGRRGLTPRPTNQMRPIRSTPLNVSRILTSAPSQTRSGDTAPSQHHPPPQRPDYRMPNQQMQVVSVQDRHIPYYRSRGLAAPQIPGVQDVAVEVQGTGTFPIQRSHRCGGPSTWFTSVTAGNPLDVQPARGACAHEPGRWYSPWRSSPGGAYEVLVDNQLDPARWSGTPGASTWRAGGTRPGSASLTRPRLTWGPSV